MDDQKDRTDAQKARDQGADMQYDMEDEQALEADESSTATNAKAAEQKKDNSTR